MPDTAADAGPAVPAARPGRGAARPTDPAPAQCRAPGTADAQAYALWADRAPPMIPAFRSTAPVRPGPAAPTLSLGGRESPRSVRRPAPCRGAAAIAADAPGRASPPGRNACRRLDSQGKSRPPLRIAMPVPWTCSCPRAAALSRAACQSRAPSGPPRRRSRRQAPPHRSAGRAFGSRPAFLQEMEIPSPALAALRIARAPGASSAGAPIASSKLRPPPAAPSACTTTGRPPRRRAPAIAPRAGSVPNGGGPCARLKCVSAGPAPGAGTPHLPRMIPPSGNPAL